MVRPDQVLQVFVLLALCSNPVLSQNYVNTPRNTAELQSFAPMGSRNQASGDRIQDWFGHYDQIRREAQMTSAERQRADTLLSKGLSIIVPGEDKTITQALLNKLVARYQRAMELLKQMPLFPETEKLHRGYYQYFRDARNLFFDYLKVQNNLFAQDDSGRSIASTLLARKQNLEMLDQANKQLDLELRRQYNIPAYQY